MERFIQKVLFSTLNIFQAGMSKEIQVLIAGGLFLIFSSHLYAANPVKPLSHKALKKIEEKYDKETRKIFSGKGSEKNVLALKRLIAEDVNPDRAIVAIRTYNKAVKYRSGSLQKRKMIQQMEVIFSGSKICWKKGRDIVIGAGTAISARKARTMTHTSYNPNKPSCRANVSAIKRAPKVKYQDPDRLAENVLLTKLTGSTASNASTVS